MYGANHGKSILVRVSASFELLRVRVTGSQLYFYPFLPLGGGRRCKRNILLYETGYDQESNDTPLDRELKLLLFYTHEKAEFSRYDSVR